MSGSDHGPTSAKTGARRPVGAGYATMAVIMALGPWLASRTWPSTPDELAAEAPGTRVTVAADLLECRPSEDWTALAAAVALLPDEPTWEEIRGLMEEGGCRPLRYVLRVRYHLDDGATDELSYVRRPYDQEHLLREFLRALGRAEELARADGDRSISSIDLRAAAPELLESIPGALLGCPPAAY